MIFFKYNVVLYNSIIINSIRFFPPYPTLFVGEFPTFLSQATTNSPSGVNCPSTDSFSQRGGNSNRRTGRSGPGVEASHSSSPEPCHKYHWQWGNRMGSPRYLSCLIGGLTMLVDITIVYCSSHGVYKPTFTFTGGHRILYDMHAGFHQWVPK